MATEAPANGVTTTLASSVTNTATTLPLTSATGFPNGQYTVLLTDGTNYELCEASALSGTNLTVARASETWGGSATSYAFGAGTKVTIVTSVQSVIRLIESYAVPLSGGTMTGPLVLSADPSAALGAATKEYADATIPYDALVAELNPSAWWKLNDAVGSTTALDSSGNGYNGTVTGGVTFGQPGAISGTPSDTAALFNGSTGYVSTAYNPSGATLSFAAWVNLPAPSFAAMVASSSNESTVGVEVAVNSSGHVSVTLGNGSTTGFIVAGVVADSTWHFITMTYDGSTIRSYIDAVPGPTVALSGAVVAGPLFRLGSYQGFVGDMFPGKMTELAFFPTALTAAQVLALYNAAPKYGPRAIANGKPAGPQTAPAIPATTVALTNPFNFDCTVYVSGGTVTAVAIGGTTTGLTSGMFYLSAGETITLTYSVAPTWTWFGN